MSKDDPPISSVAWLLMALIAYYCATGVSDAWHSKLRYSIQYGVDYDQVSEDDKPHDCDFLKSPLGDKECHYERQVTTVLTRTENSNPAAYPVNYVSFDGGQTWTVDRANPPTKALVTISWQEVDD